MSDISFNTACKELKIAQIAQLNQLFQLLLMLMSKNVINDVSKDSPIVHRNERVCFGNYISAGK